MYTICITSETGVQQMSIHTYTCQQTNALYDYMQAVQRVKQPATCTHVHAS